MPLTVVEQGGEGEDEEYEGEAVDLQEQEGDEEVCVLDHRAVAGEVDAQEGCHDLRGSKIIRFLKRIWSECFLRISIYQVRDRGRDETDEEPGQPVEVARQAHHAHEFLQKRIKLFIWFFYN